MDYYKVLNIDKKASISDIKRVYRELAKKYHPDRNPNENGEFIKISDAYTTLSDPQLRSEYDQKYVHTDIFQNLNINKMFTNKNDLQSVLLNDFIFNNIDGVVNLNYENIQTKLTEYCKKNFSKIIQRYNLESGVLIKIIKSLLIKKNKDLISPNNIQYTIQVTLDQIFQKKTKIIKVARTIKCTKCKSNYVQYKCKSCLTIRNDNTFCDNCFKFNFIETKCDCQNGYITDNKIFDIKLDTTVLNNSKIIFKEEGDFLKNYSNPGNIIIYINFIKHPEFEVRDKIHLIIEKELSLYEWLFEYNIEIYHPSNEIIPLYNSGYITKQLIKIPNKGLVCDNITGNLYIILKLDTTNIDHDEIYNRFKPHNIVDDLIVSETPECSDSISEYKN